MEPSRRRQRPAAERAARVVLRGIADDDRRQKEERDRRTAELMDAREQPQGKADVPGAEEPGGGQSDRRAGDDDVSPHQDEARSDQQEDMLGGAARRPPAGDDRDERQTDLAGPTTATDDARVLVGRQSRDNAGQHLKPHRGQPPDPGRDRNSQDDAADQSGHGAPREAGRAEMPP